MRQPADLPPVHPEIVTRLDARPQPADSLILGQRLTARLTAIEGAWTPFERPQPFGRVWSLDLAAAAAGGLLPPSQSDPGWSRVVVVAELGEALGRLRTVENTVVEAGWAIRLCAPLKDWPQQGPQPLPALAALAEIGRVEGGLAIECLGFEPSEPLPPQRLNVAGYIEARRAAVNAAAEVWQGSTQARAVPLRLLEPGAPLALLLHQYLRRRCRLRHQRPRRRRG